MQVYVALSETERNQLPIQPEHCSFPILKGEFPATKLLAFTCKESTCN